MKSGTALLLSIRPHFVEQIFEGTKTVELRRVRPRVVAGDLVIVYASGTQKALVGAFSIANVFTGTPTEIWKCFGERTGLPKGQFDNYYDGVSIGYAIAVARTWRLPVPISLSTLRQKFDGFHPPQSYRYLNLGEVVSMGGDTLLGSI